MAQTANQREDRVSTPAVVTPKPAASTPKTPAPKAPAKAPAPTPAPTSADLLNKQQTLVESWGYKINPNTGLYDLTSSASDSTGGNTSGNTSGSTSGTSVEDPLVAYQKQIDAEKRADAFSLLKDTFNQYGLSDLASTIEQFMRDNVGSNEAALRLKTDTSINPATGKAYNAPYVARFAGNVTRVANGLDALSEADYIQMEQNYSTLFEKYGQASLANKAQFAKLIGSDVSQTELNERLDLAITNVQNADPTVKATLKQFYPGITDANLVSYFLAPEDTLPTLQRQVQASQINAAAQEQGLNRGTTAQEIAGYKTSAESLAAYGVTQQQAQAGYAKIGTVLPTSTKLSDIYKEAQVDYTQGTAESEFLKGNAEAALKRKQLEQLETGSFSAKSGVGQYGLNKSIQGSF
jgi:hypothetical protein